MILVFTPAATSSRGADKLPTSALLSATPRVAAWLDCGLKASHKFPYVVALPHRANRISSTKRRVVSKGNAKGLRRDPVIPGMASAGIARLFRKCQLHDDSFGELHDCFVRQL